MKSLDKLPTLVKNDNSKPIGLKNLFRSGFFSNKKNVPTNSPLKYNAESQSSEAIFLVNEVSAFHTVTMESRKKKEINDASNTTTIKLVFSDA